MDKPLSLEHFKKTKRMQNIFRKLYGSSGDYDPIKEAHSLDEIFPAIVKSCKFAGLVKGVAQSLSPCLLSGFLEAGLVRPFEKSGVFEIEKFRVAFLSEIYFK